MGKASDARRAREASARRVAKRLGTSQAGSARARTATIKKVTRSGGGGGGGGGSSKTVTVVSAPTAPETVGQQTVTRDGTTLTFAAGTTQAQIDAAFASSAATSAALERDVKGLTENYTKDLSARDLERLRVKYNLSSSEVRDIGIAGSQIQKTLSAPQRFQARVQEAVKDGLTAREVESISQEFNLTQQEKRDLAKYGADLEKQALSPFQEDVFGRIQAVPQTFAYPVGRTSGFSQTEVGITQPQKTAAELREEQIRKDLRSLAEAQQKTTSYVSKIIFPKISKARSEFQPVVQYAEKQYQKLKEKYEEPLGSTATRIREKFVSAAADIGELQLKSPTERLVEGVESFRPITETGKPRRVSTARTVDEATQPIAQRVSAGFGTFASAPFTTIEQTARFVTIPFGIGAPFPTKFELTPEAQALRTTYRTELKEIQQKDLYPKPIAEFTEALLPKTRGEVALFGGMVLAGAAVSAVGRGAGLLGKAGLRKASGATFGAAFKAGDRLRQVSEGARGLQVVNKQVFRIGAGIQRAAAGAQTFTLTQVPQTTQLALQAGFVGFQAYRIGAAPQEQRIQQAAQITQEFAALGIGSRLLQATPIGQRLTRTERIEGFRYELLGKEPSVAFFPNEPSTIQGFTRREAVELLAKGAYAIPKGYKPTKDIADIAVEGVSKKTALQVQQVGKEYGITFGGRLATKTYGVTDQKVTPKTFTTAGTKVKNTKEYFGSVKIYDQPSVTSDYDVAVPSLYRRTVGGIKKYGLIKGLTGFRKDFDLLQKIAPFDVKGVYKVSDIKLFSPEKGLKTFVFGAQDFTGASFGAKAALQRTPSGNLVPDLRTQGLKAVEGTYNYVLTSTVTGGTPQYNPYRRPKDFEQIKSILKFVNQKTPSPTITKGVNFFEKATVTSTKQILTDPIQARTAVFKLGEITGGFKGQTFSRVQQQTPTASKVTAPLNPQDTIPKINPKYFSPLRRSAFSRRTNPYSDRKQKSAWNVPSVSKYSFGRVSPPSLKPRSSSSIFSTSLKFSGKPSVSPSPSKQQSFSVSRSASRSRSVSPSFSPSPSPSPSLSPSLSPSISPSVSPSFSPSPSFSYGFSPSPSRSISPSLYYSYRRPPRVPSFAIDFPAGARTGFAFAVPRFEQRKRYAPTLRAVFGGIKAKRGKTKRLTGLEERPILI